MSGRLHMLGFAAASTLALALVPPLVHTPSAIAQSAGDAEALNDDGKRLFKERRYLEAYKRFKQATALAPKGKYYFNLCFSLNYLERFLFTGERIRQPVGSLSGGERARVALAKMLLGKMNVLLLDEPTNDLDVATLGALEQLLLGFKGTALVVTHDRYFLNRIATSVLAFEPGGRVSLYRGNYDAYLANRPARAALEAAAKKALSEVQQPSPSASADPVAKSTVKLGYKDKRELDGLPAQIEGWEAKISAVEAKLADPDLYTKDTALAAELNTELAQLTTELDSKMERWEFLETKREGG